SHNIQLSYVVGRPTYGHCFALANELYRDQKIIVSNADIFFNETLSLLLNYDLNNKFLALTRWNVLKDFSIEPYYWFGQKVECSQDTWIFKSPIRRFDNDNIKLGTQ